MSLKKEPVREHFGLHFGGANKWAKVIAIIVSKRFRKRN